MEYIIGGIVIVVALAGYFVLRHRKRTKAKSPSDTKDIYPLW